MTPDANKLDGNKLVQEILLNRYDGCLPEIIAACKLVDNGNRVHWRLAIEGLPEITTQNVTMYELDRVERLSGLSWVQIAGDPLALMRITAALLSAVLIEREGLTPEQVKDRLKGVTADQVVAGFSHYEVDDVPLVPAGQDNETST